MKSELQTDKFDDMQDYIKEVIQYLDEVQDLSKPGFSKRNSEQTLTDKVNEQSKSKPSTPPSPDKSSLILKQEPKVFLYKTFTSLMSEVISTKKVIEELKGEVFYAKQKENKLMYLFFILHQKGFPVNEIYDQKLKDIPTA